VPVHCRMRGFDRDLIRGGDAKFFLANSEPSNRLAALGAHQSSGHTRLYLEGEHPLPIFGRAGNRARPP
jgi:hypothetical protein